MEVRDAEVCQLADEAPRANPFAFVPRAMLAGLILAAVLMAVFFLLK